MVEHPFDAAAEVGAEAGLTVGRVTHFVHSYRGRGDGSGALPVRRRDAFRRASAAGMALTAAGGPVSVSVGEAKTL
jgi:hypothetical protein